MQLHAITVYLLNVSDDRLLQAPTIQDVFLLREGLKPSICW